MKNYLALLALALLFACSSNNQSTTTKDSLAKANVDTTAASTALNFKDEKLQQIYSAYIKLKDQLVATKFDTAKPAATHLATALNGFSGCENAALIAANIANAKDIAAQRKAFNSLNIELIPVFKQASLTKGTIFVQHCPMANNGNGGDWLSSEKKIQNPYYGDEMMECGRVAEEITSI